MAEMLQRPRLQICIIRLTLSRIAKGEARVQGVQKFKGT